MTTTKLRAVCFLRKEAEEELSKNDPEFQAMYEAWKKRVIPKMKSKWVKHIPNKYAGNPANVEFDMDTMTELEFYRRKGIMNRPMVFRTIDGRIVVH